MKIFLYITKKVKGYSLVEILVVLGLFSSISSLSLGALFNAQTVNTKLQETQTILDNVNLSLQTITRDIRFSSNFYATTTIPSGSSGGQVWTTGTSISGQYWNSITYGKGIFVAVSSKRLGNSVMTSPDGINWTSRTSAADNNWSSVTFGNNIFVAVAYSGVGNRVMTSPDGINWTLRTSAADNFWNSVTFGNNLFVAVSLTGTGNKVMTSPDGINWTIQVSAVDNFWQSVTFGNNLFVAVANTGTGNRVMTSPDGITWTSRTSAADNAWFSVTFGNNLFVAVAGGGGSGNRVMTSPDGINWTSQVSAEDTGWFRVVYGNGQFIAVSQNGEIMTSPNGVIWTLDTVHPLSGNWRSLAYSDKRFVTVDGSGAGSAMVLSSGQPIIPLQRRNCVTGCNVLIMKPSDAVTSSDRVAYYVSNGILYKSTYPNNGTMETLQMTSDDVIISSLTFYVDGAQTSDGSNDEYDVTDYKQPLITVLLSGSTRSAKSNATASTFNIETAISAHELDN